MLKQKYLFNFFIVILFSGLLDGGDLAFSEDNSPEQVEHHDTKDLEELLKRYNTDSEKILEDTSKINEIGHDASTTEIKDSEIEEVRPVLESAKKLDSPKLPKKSDLNVSTSYSEAVRAALLPLQRLSELELLNRFKESSKDSTVMTYLENYPKISLFAVRLIKDKESIPSMVKIVEQKDKLIQFTSLMLFSVIFGFILKKLFHRNGRSFLGAVFFFILRIHIMLGLRLFIIYYFFSEEFSPAALVFKKTFL